MQLRNIAIIAHVDHGKTTLVDAIFRHAGVFRANQAVAERAMDSNDLERERGITILSKCTAVTVGDLRLNIVDTPGHADFGGEVERILKMVDGVVLLVDSAEGPMPQTKFVTMKALALGLRPIVVINKLDRTDARPHEVLDEIFDLFALLDAEEAQLDFPALYASGRDGWAVTELEDERGDLQPLFDLIRDHVPAPDVAGDAPFAMLATLLDYDPFLGRVLTGRIAAGRIRQNENIKALNLDGSVVERSRATKLLSFRGLERVAIEEAEAGDIIAIAGLAKATVAHTICAAEVSAALPSPPVDPPTLAMSFAINNSPLAGRDGDKVTSRVIRARLQREAEGNVAIRISETVDQDRFEVAGRGELQLGVLIETMRREGYELTIGRPRVLYREDPESGKTLEPVEEVQIDVDDAFTGVVVEKMSARRASLLDMRPSGGGKTRLTFHAPSRGLIGYHGEFLTDTRGSGVMHRIFHDYSPLKGPVDGRRSGAIISTESGNAVPYALWHMEDRGVLFISAGEQVYPGMIIGENAKQSDLEVNPLRSKQLTNIRAAGKDEAVRLTAPAKMSLEEAIAWIADDEVVEVTPKYVRLRKAILDPHERRKDRRRMQALAAEG